MVVSYTSLSAIHASSPSDPIFHKFSSPECNQSWVGLLLPLFTLDKQHIFTHALAFLPAWQRERGTSWKKKAILLVGESAKTSFTLCYTVAGLVESALDDYI